MDPETLVGTTLDGRYEVVRIIGAGAMGCVFEALHTGTGRRVALKVISTGDVARNAALVGRFQREARAAGSVETQHIAQVLDTGTDPKSGLPFMVMEYLVGEDLQRLIRRTGPVAPELALRIVGQACIGLQKAHEARVIHRDIKPANLFLATRELDEVIVKVLDFGIAKIKMDHLEGTESGGLTRTGSMLGSPLYMSPEQARGAKAIDHRADIWSLGIVLYQALSGKTPYEHIEALGELIIVICSEPAKPVQDLAPWVPSEVAAIVHRALLHDPGHRYQSAQEMLDAIKALCPDGLRITTSMLEPLSEQQKALRATRLVAPQEVIRRPSAFPPPMAPKDAERPAEAAEAAGTDAPVTTSPGIERSRSPLIVAGAAAAVVVFGGGAFFAMRSREPEPPAPPAAADVVSQQARETPAATAATQTAPVVSPAAPERTVKVVVFPEDVGVSVDGADVKAKDGVVEIKGTLGSVHKVRLWKDKAESEVEVVVTESGALPPKIELEVKHASGTAPKKTAPATSSAPTTAPTTPPAPRTPPGFDPNFD